MTKINDDLQLLIAGFRARGGKVSTNVINGHNLTFPDGRDVRIAGSREPGHARDRLLTILRAEQRVATERAEQHERKLAAAREVAAYEIGDPSWADLIIDTYRNA